MHRSVITTGKDDTGYGCQSTGRERPFRDDLSRTSFPPELFRIKFGTTTEISVSNSKSSLTIKMTKF